jgi:hypothetical protein
VQARFNQAQISSSIEFTFTFTSEWSEINWLSLSW